MTALVANNLPSAPDWLKMVLYSGEVTKVGQHLALVLFHISDEKGYAAASVRDLERITGWGRQTIADHLGELRDFMAVKIGIGRAKSEFELQCGITEAIKHLRIVHDADAKVKPVDNPTVQQADTNPKPTTSSVQQPDNTQLASTVASTPRTLAPQPSRAPAPARIEPFPSGRDSTLEKDSPFFPQSEPDVAMDGKGRLQISGKLREFWLREFGGDAKGLELALIDSARFIQPNSRKLLEVQVSGQLARRASEKRDKDARYAAAVARNSTQSQSGKPKETDPNKIMDAIVNRR